MPRRNVRPCGSGTTRDENAERGCRSEARLELQFVTFPPLSLFAHRARAAIRAYADPYAGLIFAIHSLSLRFPRATAAGFFRLPFDGRRAINKGALGGGNGRTHARGDPTHKSTQNYAGTCACA